MCGTAPSFVWYIQHLVQHHDLEPQEEQSWQQQNVEDTLSNYDSFFDRFSVVNNGLEIWKKWNQTLKTWNTSTIQHVFKKMMKD